MNTITYIIEDSELVEEFKKLDLTLGNIEVKGDSVANLFNARMILKNLFSKIKEKKEDEGGEM